jgi:hypothetical protein
MGRAAGGITLWPAVLRAGDFWFFFARHKFLKPCQLRDFDQGVNRAVAKLSSAINAHLLVAKRMPRKKDVPGPN